MRVNGTKYQLPFALVIGRDSEEELKFGKVVTIYVDGQSTIFEFLPMLTYQAYHHYHAYALKSQPLSSRCMYLIKHSDLVEYHPYGLYHSTSVSTDTTLEYVGHKSNVYIPVS